MKSSNFFAALGENSDDEEVVVAPTKTVVSGSSIKENSANANHPKTQVTLIEPSKVDDRYVCALCCSRKCPLFFMIVLI